LFTSTGVEVIADSETDRAEMLARVHYGAQSLVMIACVRRVAANRS
jgi:hypothetical protein